MKELRKQIFKNEGMALLTVLTVLIILLILSIAIVSLSTGNLKIVGNISSRFQALNHANSACMYAIYDISSSTIPNSYNWPPGSKPTPITGLSFEVYQPIHPSKLNGLPGKCTVAFVNNLNNPNEEVVTAPAGVLSSYFNSSIDVPGEGAVIVAQGEYGGFKRAIMVTLKNTYYSLAAENQILCSTSDFLLSGIEDISILSPGSSPIYCGGDVIYNDLRSHRILQGSTICCTGNISVPSSGTPIPDNFLDPNYPALPFMDWSLFDPLVTEGPPSAYPVNEINYTLNVVAIPPPSSAVPPIPTVTIKRPSFSQPYAPAPNINDDECYMYTGTMDITGNTFINGSLYIDGELNIPADFNLFVNGILIVGGAITSNSRGNIFVTGYVNNDPNDINGSFPYGLGMDVMTLAGQYGIDTTNDEGVGIFTDGDIHVGTANLSYMYTPEVNEWLKASPPNTETIIDTFEMLGLCDSTGEDVYLWFNGPGSFGNLVSIPGKTGREILLGQANQELIDMGLKPVPDEIAEWFNHPNADNSMTWASRDMFGGPALWDTFKHNPGLYTSANDVFLQAVIHTHGKVTLGFNSFYAPPPDPWWPTRIVGGVITAQKSLYSPQDNPSDPGTTHGGILDISGGSSIIFYPLYFQARGGKFLLAPILTIYSWQEL